MNEQDLKNRVLQQLQGLSHTLVDTVGDMSKGRNVFCPSNIVNERMSICNGCPEFVTNTSQCKQCGCFMSAKSRLKKASCPIGKWTPHND
tara:strand:+ start:1033 stop:1302 length:270 start_codon:yes stop_codon:yes gene_type:complete